MFRYFFFVLLFLPFVRSFADETKGSLEAFVVVIDPGHGGNDPGAIGKYSYEKNINLSIAQNLGNQIKANHKDVKVVYTRETDKQVSLAERSQIANRAGADLFISIHTNALSNEEMRGVETYIFGVPTNKVTMDVALRENLVDGLFGDSGTDLQGGNSLFLRQNLFVAAEIQKAFEKGNRINNGVRQARFMVLKNAGMPAVLVEVGYITNEIEEKYMNSVAGEKAIAKAIYAAFTKYKNSDGKNSVFKINSEILSKKQTEKNIASSKTVGNSAVNDAGNMMYRIQFLLSDKKLPKDSPKFKGLSPVGFYVEKGLYKYTYGESNDLKEIVRQREGVQKTFHDAFIVIFKDGRRVGIYSGN